MVLPFTEEKVKHPIVKALLAKGYKEFTIIYEPRFSPSWGFTCVDSPYFEFLGYTIQESLRTIQQMKSYDEILKEKCITYIYNLFMLQGYQIKKQGYDKDYEQEKLEYHEKMLEIFRNQIHTK